MSKNSTGSINKLLSTLTAAVLLFTFISSTAAFADGLPKADKNGNYSENCTHRYWQVIDPDPAGLNGRLSKDLAAIWYSPDNNWPDFDFFKWPVIRRFKTGTILIGNGEPDSFVMSKDSKGDPWLCVNIGDMDTEAVCFVRANKKYIVPVPKANADAPYTYPLAQNINTKTDNNVLAKPNEKSGVIDKIIADRIFLVISDEDEYVKILTPTGKTGYINTARIRMTGKRAVGAAVIRSEQSTMSVKIGIKKSIHLDNGEVVYLLSPGKKAKFMDREGKQGKISSKNLNWLPLDFKN